MLAASTLESARLMLLSKSTAHPNGIGNSSNHVGHNFCEHVMGPGVTGLVKERVGKPKTIDDGRPGWILCAEVQEHLRQASELHPRLRLRGHGRQPDVSRTMLAKRPALARHTRRPCATSPARSSTWAASARCWRATRTRSRSIPVRRDKWGIPVLRFNYKFGDNEKKMCEDMANAAQEMFEVAGFEIVNMDRTVLTEGLVDPRARHRPHGHRQEDVGAEPVPAVA